MVCTFPGADRVLHIRNHFHDILKETENMPEEEEEDTSLN